MIKLHLGCGALTKEGWINIDIGANPNTGHTYLQKDLSNGLPATMPDNSVDFIFHEHFLEHLHWDQALVLLTSCYKKLKPNGVMRITVPDLDYLIKRYIDNNIVWSVGGGGWEPKNRCHMINEGFKNWGHQFQYNSQELQEILQLAGFHNSKMDFGILPRQSKHPELQDIDTRLATYDIRVEVVK